MSLLAHLNFTFKVMFKVKELTNVGVSNPAAGLHKIAEIISQLDSDFSRCLANFKAFINEVCKFAEMQPIRQSLPVVMPYLPSTLTSMATEEALRLMNSPDPFLMLLAVRTER